MTQIVNRIADQQADRRLAQLVDADRRKWEITELAAKLTGNGERALPVKVATITDFLLSLDPEQFVMAKSIFETISQNGLIEFTEMGHGRRLRKQPLPQEYHDMLRRTIKAGNDVDEFFNLAGLSDPSDYDLSQFEENK